MKFRKKPVVIDAEQYTVGGTLPFVELGVLDYDEDTQTQGIQTLEGRMIVSDGDWVIRGVKGEFYPCKPDIFAATYEPA
jgi:bifunctional ADP-heptose synthase (sugar kinase/adenylyltransferase)